MSDDHAPNHTERVYNNLMHAFRAASKSGDEAKAKRIDDAIRVLEELWPEDCARWRARFGQK